MIAMVYEEPFRGQRLFESDDLPWIDKLIDIVEQSVGQPWRALVERVEHAPLRAHRSNRTAILAALRRVLGGAGQRARIARQVRDLVLGAPALTSAERRARLDAAAATLGTTAADVESLLWVDLAMERPVALPSGRPTAADLAAVANLERIQRWVRRAHDLQLRVWDRANELVRTVARYGLIAQITRDGEATLFDVIGPLALFHSTMVYGRALAALVPLLADHPRFELDLCCRLGGELTQLRVVPPVLLPPVPAASPRRPPSVAERLARDLAVRGHSVALEPPPITSGARLLFPNLMIQRDSQRWYIEVLGFSTKEAVTAKLASYREAGASVVLCIDLAMAPGCDFDPHACSFTRYVNVDDLLAMLGMDG